MQAPQDKPLRKNTVLTCDSCNTTVDGNGDTLSCDCRTETVGKYVTLPGDWYEVVV